MSSTKKQEVYNYITQCWQSGEISPSIREICAALKIKSTSSVHKYLKELEDEGLITKPKLKKRSTVPSTAERTVNVPILGRVAAGVPITAQEDFEGFIGVPSGIAGDGEHFALKIKGNSMKNAGILSGDIVVVRRQNFAENGEIVVALLEDEATVKRFFAENGKVRLQPENEDFKPIFAENLEVLGKVVASMRYY